MSREGSPHTYQDDEEINLYDRNDEVLLPFVDDPEQLIRNRRARDREAIRRNQEPPEDRNAAGPVQQPPRYPPPPRQMPRREPVFDNYYRENNDLHEPTLGELSAPYFRNQLWCIHEGPELENISINTSVAHNLPKFSGTRGESAMTHLQRLHGICQNTKPNGVNVDDFKLKALYFSLIDAANDWFLSLPSGSIRTWAQMQKKFLDKYYPAGWAMQVRRQLQEIKQGPNETMYDYLEKFNRLERSCCTLGLPEKLTIEYLIDGIRPLDKMLLDASAGGSMMNLSLSGIRDLITNVAENARFEEMKQLKEMMIQILRRQPVPVKPCEFCGSTEHKTDACPTLLEEEPEEVNAVGGYRGYNNNTDNRAGQNRQYGQATNPGWRNNSYPQKETQPAVPQLAHSYYQPPHRQYTQNVPGQYQQKGPNQYQTGPNNQQETSKSLDDTMKELTGSISQLGTSLHQFQAKTDGAISDLTKQMSQLATAMSTLTSEPGRLPSQTVQHPKANLSMIQRPNVKTTLGEVARSPAYKLTNKHFNRRHRPDWNQEEDRPDNDKTWVTHADNGRYAFTVCITPPPIIHSDIPASGWDDEDNLKWNSPTNIYAPRQNICRENRKFNGVDYTIPKPRNGQNGPTIDRARTSDHESQPERDKDPGAFTITCGIGETQIHKCLIDLGAAVNAMPSSLYCLLGLGPLKPSRTDIELGDKSCICPVGVLENVILHVGELVVAADFYVLQTGKTSKDDPPTIILGRPFLYDTKARIDVGRGSLSLEFGGKIANFYINNSRPNTKEPPDIIPISDHGTQNSDLPKERVARPGAMVKGASPSQKQWKEKTPKQRSSNSNKKSGRDKTRSNTGTVAKYDLSHPWDPNQ
ncbi:unnamed protein product [Rhodiola kirilowii]